MGEMPMHGGGTLSMMLPMMLPPFGVMLWRYHRAAARSAVTAITGLSYLVVLSAIEFVAAQSLAAALIIGILPRLPWPKRLRAAAGAREVATDGGSAWRCGVRLAIDCGASCAPLMAVAMAVGSVKLHLLAGVIAAIRLSPDDACRIPADSPFQRPSATAP